jgi:hypothetical protein
MRSVAATLGRLIRSGQFIKAAGVAEASVIGGLASRAVTVKAVRVLRIGVTFAWRG